MIVKSIVRSSRAWCRHCFRQCFTQTSVDISWKPNNNNFLEEVTTIVPRHQACYFIHSIKLSDLPSGTMWYTLHKKYCLILFNFQQPKILSSLQATDELTTPLVICMLRRTNLQLGTMSVFSFPPQKIPHNCDSCNLGIFY